MIRLEKIESEKLVDLVIYFLVIILGVVVLASSFYGVENHLNFIATIYYILSAVFFIAYFVFRKPFRYEKLFISLATAIVSTTLFFSRPEKALLMLGMSIFVFTALLLIIKLFGVLVLKKEKKSEWEVKIIISLFITLIGVLSGYVLVHQVFFQMTIYGYFFIVFGIISLFEPVILILLSERATKK